MQLSGIPSWTNKERPITMATKSHLTIYYTPYKKPSLLSRVFTFRPNREKTLARLETIEELLQPLYRQYEGVARGSKEHTQVWMKISNLETERDSLQAVMYG